MAAAREARRRSAFDGTLGVRAVAGPAHRAGWAFTKRCPQRVQRRIGVGAAVGRTHPARIASSQLVPPDVALVVDLVVDVELVFDVELEDVLEDEDV